MMGRTFKINIHQILMGSIFLLLASCVPKATEKKANCGSGQSFNSVTRECVSTQKARSTPVATTQALTFTERQIQDFTLSYTDKDSDLAVSCKVVDSDTKIEVYSPKMSEALIEAKKLVEYMAMANTTHNAHVPGGSHIATINAQLLDLQDDIDTIENNYSINAVIPAYEDLLAKSVESYNLMKNFTSTSLLVYYNNLVRDQLLVGRPFIESAVNRCYCDGAGVCKTRGGVIGKKTGPASFNYLVTDALDGDSISKQVTVSITKTNDAPQAAFYFVENFYESASSSPLATGGIALPSVYDADGNAVTFVKLTNPSLGTATCTSSSCSYTPANGNANTTVAKVKGTVDFHGVRFTANHFGSWANDLVITFKNFTSTEDRFFESGPFLKVNYPNIDIYVPAGFSFTPSVIVDIINDHPYLSLLGSAVDIAGGASQTVGTLPESFNVASGSGGYDSFEFKYRDSNGAESNTAKIIYDLIPANDPPTPIFVSTAPVQTITRNGTAGAVAFSNINLYDGSTLFYTDPDATNNLATSCQVSFSSFTPGPMAVLESLSTPSKAELGTCTCALDGKCSFEMRSTHRMSPGSILVYYAFDDGINASTSVQSMQVTITPSNVAPSFGVAAVDNSVDEDDDWSELVRVPVWVNDAVTTDSEVVSGSTRQDIQYSMSLSGATNPSIYNSTDLTQSFRTSYLTCTTDCSTSCTSASATVSTGITNYITLGIGSSATVTKCLKVDYRPASMPEQSGSFDLTLRLKDVPKTTGEVSLTSTDLLNTITVNNINDKPLVVGFSSAGSEIVLETLETAENSQALSFAYTVEEGGDDAENTDKVLINSISSDNTTLLPLSRVEVIFDRDGDGLYEKSGGGDSSVNDNEVFSAAEALPIELEDLDDVTYLVKNDSKGNSGMLVGRRLLFKVNPTPGNFGVANVRFTLQDDGAGAPTSAKTYVVSVVVHPVSTTHGGWTHLEAQGIKLTKRNTSLTQSFDCATGARFTGSGSPNGIQTSHSTDKMDIFYDSTFKNCYYSTIVNTTNNWFTLNTYCPMSKKCKTGNSKTCLFETTDPDLATIQSTLGENEVYGVVDTSTHEVSCYRIDNQQGVAYAPSSVTLAWKPFQVITSSGSITPVLTGYKVFRRKLNEEYDLTKPLTTVNQSELSYTDTTAFGGRAYYYKVVPVVTFNSKTINVFPTENFSEVRMVAPAANYSFVHRWMANQEVCNKMGFTVSQAAPNRVDPTNNYRCPYRGPGATVAGVNSYYDIGNDYLVDTFESGCPFTEKPHCVVNGTNAACIGLAAPQENADVEYGDVYYRRSTGQCFAYDSDGIGGNWVEFKDLPADSGDFNGPVVAGDGKSSIALKTTTNFNPPVTNITRSNANSFCAMRDPVSIFTNGAVTQNTSAFALPNRKEQIAFSAGPMEKQSSNKSYNEYADSAIQTIEDGQSLNQNAYCNANYANGLESNFVDADYPPSSLLYTLAGNSSSSIRSLVTGSVAWGNYFKGTTMCVSRYGLQDIYGNVGEWVSDAFSWYNDPALAAGTHPVSAAAITYDYIRSTETYMQFDSDGDLIDDKPYAFDYEIGPCNDSSTDNRCSAQDYISTTDWDISERFFGATRMAFPVGLPFTDTFASSYSLSPIHDYLLDIGRASGGISSGALHGDKFTINDQRPDQHAEFASGNVSMSTGGNYTSGNAAGRYSFELHPAEYKDEKTGFRCRAVVNY